jgi:hypothetical protein
MIIMEKLAIQNIDGYGEDATITYYRETKPSGLWVLEFTSSVIKNKYVDVDIFECLISLRQDLASYNYFPLCNGARIDVYPSGMCRDMGNGLVALKCRLGEQTNIEDLVGVLDYAQPYLIGSVEEQLEFHQRWLNSDGEPTELKIQHDDGTIVDGSLFIYYGVDPNRIKFISSVTPELEFINNNYFDCLNDLRRELDRINYRPLCNGARLDTYVLDTIARMMSGNDCYHLVEGKIPTQNDELRIFDYADPESIVSIDEQKEHYESWLNSVKSIFWVEYEEYGIYYLPEIYFRLIKIGDLPLTWLFDVEPAVFQSSYNPHNIIKSPEDVNKYEDTDEQPRVRALSPLSPEQVEQIRSLQGEAIVGFITGDILSLDYFSYNKVFVNFIQKVIATKAPKDSELQATALAEREGQLHIIDNRVADNKPEEIFPEDIIGTLEIKDGQIVAGSYQPNPDYLVFGNNGLMQLPGALHEALIDALLSQFDSSE